MKIYFKKKFRYIIDLITNLIYSNLVLGLFFISLIFYISVQWKIIYLPLAFNLYTDYIPEFVLGPSLLYFCFYIREKKVNDILRNLALLAYYDFKKNVIMQFQFLLEGSSSDPEEFYNLKAFRKKFGEDNWYRIANQIEERDLQIFRTQAKFLHDELTQLLNSKSSTNKQALTLLKGLCWQLSDICNCFDEYESRKSLLLQLWNIFSGWNSISGYTDRDLIEKAINDL